MIPSRLAPLLGAIVLIRCSLASPPQPNGPGRNTPSQEEGLDASDMDADTAPLSSYLPAAGLKWLVQLRPQELLAAPSFLEPWSFLIGPERLKAFSQVSGIEPEQVKELWIASYPLGTLYLLDASQVGESAEAAFRRRALSTSARPTSSANMVHLTAVMDDSPYAFLRVGTHLVAIAVGDISLTRIVQAYAEGRLSKSKPALHGKWLSPLQHHKPDAPIHLFALGPYPEAEDPTAQLFVSGVLALIFAGNRIHVSAEVTGLWPLESRLGHQLDGWLLRRFSRNELQAIGVGSPVSLSPITCDELPPTEQNTASFTLCRGSGVWNSEELATAVHRITSAPLHELLSEELSPAAHSPPPAGAKHEGTELAPEPESPLP